ncbi:DNA-(apurinic or apyrimidinic site) lyase 2 [Ceratocystis fimbriata CBS 114723]|uniref:DNA-(Apurinic or apyrimidinic site) lyase 2 n=1 Tax=Ceratocystis fimbriata CBS 114723 TaxID=1035309 RepID=A0A2C5X2A9_9PEZI|nr:DNA-(apurinic or apyrimidinic site) lyase 2 [Ceratocystis fimbriata CBS 114723]
MVVIQPTPTVRVGVSSHAATALDEERVYDPIEAKESWSGLLGNRRPPLCEHNEACVSLKTKKPGMNCGRSFFMCARPLGPSGDKESGTEWRCGTFIWSSEWNRSSSRL